MESMVTTSSVAEGQIIDALKETRGYATATYLSGVTGAAPEQVALIARAHPDKIRESVMKTDAGEALFMVNAPLSAVADYWNAFRALNDSKY